MASSADSSDRLDASTTGDDSVHDPFVSASSAISPSHFRFSNFDQELFAAGPGSSPLQAKRALEAHLAETDRRLDEAGKLGTALVSQRRTLVEQLNEVEKLQADVELTPELRQKFEDIKKEFHDLRRESARVFLPKQRVPSNEHSHASPYLMEGRSGRRSVSPSKFESSATGSPTKLTVPSRKQRNQPANRVDDIQFAAEISTSLIAQVRNLQALLGERDEQVKDLRNDMSKIEQESEAFQQRLKIVDESEHRYREENWDLQTRLQETASQQREAADREKKLNHALQLANIAKTSAQKELDEVKLSHAKLTEEHATATKYHDIEIGTARRNIAALESERAAMQRKIEDLTSQNQELAKAITAERMRSQERESELASRNDDFELFEENVTPEHSPPSSPVKITPRHSMLEAETMKTSLQHAQRTIQNQRSLLHREKTEKLELKRIIQDLRDDLEKARNDLTAGGGVPMTRRGRKPEPKETIKKPPRLLGSFRSSRQEVVSDDPEWEDTHDLVPRTASFGTVEPLLEQHPKGGRVLSSIESGDEFATANEASESAFESARERVTTETDDLPTGTDGYSDSDGGVTETEETPSKVGLRGVGAIPNLSSSFARHGYRASLDSTASTSADEDNALPLQLRTPSAAPAHGRYRSRGAHSTSRQVSEEPFVSSPASFVSRNRSAVTSPQAGQSLFAELQDLGSDDDSIVYTPGRRSTRSSTPGSTRRALSPPPPMPEMPKMLMVDSGMMTEPVEFAVDRLPTAGSRGSFLSVVEVGKRPKSVESVIRNPDFRASPTWWQAIEEEEDGSRPASTIAYSDAGAQYEDMDEKLSQFPAPPSSPPRALQLSPPSLIFSLIQAENIEPVEEPETKPILPSLAMTPILVQQDVEPIPEPEAAPLALIMSTICAENVEPVPEPKTPLSLIMSEIAAETLEPIEEPEIPPPALSLSNICAEHLEPQVTPQSHPPPLTLSTIHSEGLVPIVEPETLPPALSLSAISAEGLEPQEESVAARPKLVLSTVFGEHWEPRAHPIASPSSPQLVASRDMAPLISAAPKLSMSSVTVESVEPVMGPLILPPSLPLSAIQSQQLIPGEEPVQSPVQSPVPGLVYSSIFAEDIEPHSEVEPLLPAFDFSPIAMEQISPVEEPSPASPSFAPSPIYGVEVPSPSKSARDGPLTGHFAFSSIHAIDTRPMTPRSPRRDGFILPKDIESPFSDDPSSAVSRNNLFAQFLNRQQNKDDASNDIAGDETLQSSPTNDAEDVEALESQLPLRETSANGIAHLPRHYAVQTNDQGAQTSLTGMAMDQLLKSGSRNGHVRDKAPATAGGRVENASAVTDHAVLRRPESAMSARSCEDALLLPPSQQQHAVQARSGSAGGAQSHGSMGPPLWPASALKGRPRTPSQHNNPVSGRGTPTHRMVRGSSSQSNAEFHTPVKTSGVSRQSSVSSFVSELDTRFNIRASEVGPVDAPGFSPNTDPRMIQAITQTMIGEFLWKYTRKTGRGELSEKRHRRYFWVHPYTRTIYWSERDPSLAGVRAKSLPIEAVRVVTDDNPMPPGLYRKSLVIVSPGRAIKFTCTTGQRHETWFNALSYLLLRTTHAQHHSDAEDLAESMAREDVDEFNPGMGRRAANGNRLMAPSLSSYNSRTTRNDSQFDRISLDVPTLTPGNKSSTANKSNMGASLGSKLGGYLRSGGPKLRSRTSNQNMIYEASEAHDSAEDVREIIERQDREADRLENVRQCCDGKHDVGTIPHTKRRSAHIQLHSHPGPSPVATTPIAASMRSRA